MTSVIIEEKKNNKIIEKSPVAPPFGVNPFLVYYSKLLYIWHALCFQPDLDIIEQRALCFMLITSGHEKNEDCVETWSFS